MANQYRLRQREAERVAEHEKQAILENFVKEQEGKTAELFIKRLKLVETWFTRIQPIFSEYKKNFDEFKKFERLTPRLPKSDYIIQLSLDISPKMSELLTELTRLKSELYESIRSTRIKKGTKQKLELDKDERNKLKMQFNALAPAIDLENPDWDKLFFPDESFSVSQEDIQNPRKPLDFDFTKYYFAVNQAILRVGSEIKKQNKQEAVRTAPEIGSEIFDEAHWEAPDEIILPSDSGGVDPQEGEAG